MNVWDMQFLFAFLPIYMLLFAILPPKTRPYVIAIGNAFFAAASGISAIAYPLCTLCAYISGLIIEKRKKLTKAILIFNYLLGGAVLLIGSPRGISGFNGFACALSAVMPLHMISYVSDVKNGCDAQKNFFKLAAYTGFFPSAGFGPVLRYRTSRRSFDSPTPRISQLSKGIGIYVSGLALYVIIAARLIELRTELINTPENQLGAGTVLLGIFICYTAFFTTIIGSVLMGNGLALMQGISTGKCFPRKFLQPDIAARISEFNLPFARWVKLYISRPLRHRLGKVPAVALSITAASLWYGFSTEWLVTGAILGAAAALQQVFKSENRTASGDLIAVISAKLTTLFAVAVCAIQQLELSGNLKSIHGSNSQSDEFFGIFFSESILVLTIGILVTSSLIRFFVSKMNLRLLRPAVPAAELMFFALAVAYMVR